MNEHSNCDCSAERCDPVFVDDIVEELGLDDDTACRLERQADYATADGRAYFLNRRAAANALNLARTEGGGA